VIEGLMFVIATIPLRNIKSTYFVENGLDVLNMFASCDAGLGPYSK